MKPRFIGHKKAGKSLLTFAEKRFVDKLVPHVSNVFETYELTWLTLLWSIIIAISGYLAKNNIYWLIPSSIAIALQYFTDHFDGAIGRKKKTGLIKWGYFMDHFLDYIFLCSLIIGYSFLLNESYYYLIFIVFFIFTGFMICSFLEFSATNLLRIYYFFLGPTEIRIGFIILNIAIIVFGPSILTTILPIIIFFSGIGLVIVVQKTQKRLWNMDMKYREKLPKIISSNHLRKNYRYFGKKYIAFLLVAIFAYLNVYVYLTNPFHTLSIVKSPFTTTVENSEIVLHKNFSINVGENPFQSVFAFYKAGVHILANTYAGSNASANTTENGVISDIHALRFNPKKPFLISGDHFSMLYPRNLGIFYASLLNPNTALSKNDWENRERIYLQTTAYTLEAFANAGNVFTTIVPTGIHTVTPINIFAYPSDSLYGVLYALDILQNNTLYDNKVYSLQTTEAARQLIYTYDDSLRNLLQIYSSTVFDKKSGLIKKNINLSSARDSVMRSSSFYDNVIYWKTLQLANALHIQTFDKKYLDELKQRVIFNFWNKKDGFFLNDLSGKQEYSSDWLIAVETGFLNPQDISERKYIEKSVQYIMKNNIDKPFALKYQKDSDPSSEFTFVRYFVPSYGQNAIWSYWGMEYIKTLLELYKQTGNDLYLTKAAENIAIYDENIVKYRGFPEVYSKDGEFLQNAFYKSVRQTGWVVGFEEVKWMYATTTQEKPLARVVKE